MTTVEQITLLAANVFLVRGPSGTILVDSAIADSADTIVQRLDRLGIRRGDLSLIFLTHGHLDHFGGAGRLRAALDAPVAIHERDAANLRAGRNLSLGAPRGLFGQLIRGWAMQAGEPVEPDIVFGDDFRTDSYGVPGIAIPTPGHSAGSVTLLLDGGQAIAGDLLVGGWVGGRLRGSVPNYPYFVEDLAEIRASVQRVLRAGAQQWYVGHGGPLHGAAIWQRFATDFGARRLTERDAVPVKPRGTLGQ